MPGGDDDLECQVNHVNNQEIDFHGHGEDGEDVDNHGSDCVQRQVSCRPP